MLATEGEQLPGHRTVFVPGPLSTFSLCYLYQTLFRLQHDFIYIDFALIHASLVTRECSSQLLKYLSILTAKFLPLDFCNTNKLQTP